MKVTLLLLSLIVVVLSKDTTYIVKAGDCLSKIASKYGVTIAQLQQWNGISNPDYISIGQKLIVKKNSSKASSGDTIYIVKAGDCLGKIASKYGVTIAQLQQWNGISNPDYISIGQKIIIKKGDSTAPSIPEQTGGTYTITDSQMQRMGWKNYNLNDLNSCLKRFQINTSLRVRHFIAQTSLESGLGKWTEELGDTSYCSKYDYRTDLGNIYAGDGCKYKGAGYIQLTGRANYQSFANFINDQNVMQGVSYVASKYPWTSAGYFWYTNNFNSFVDGGATVKQVTKRVNGGYNGLEEREAYYAKACTIF